MFPVNFLLTATDQLCCCVIRPLHCSFIVIIFYLSWQCDVFCCCYILWEYERHPALKVYSCQCTKLPVKDTSLLILQTGNLGWLAPVHWSLWCIKDGPLFFQHSVCVSFPTKLCGQTVWCSQSNLVGETKLPACWT